MAKKPAKPRASAVKTHAYSSPRHLAVKGTNPEKAYRFVRKDDSSVGMREQVGWVVSDDAKITGPGKKESTTRETHDLILMEMPRDQHDEIKKIPGLRSKARIEGAVMEGGEIMEKTKITNDHLKDSDTNDTIFEDN